MLSAPASFVQTDLGVSIDIPRSDKDSKRPSANVDVLVKGTEENVLRAKPFIAALAKGAWCDECAEPLPLAFASFR